ncbi:unnamed protein product [Phaedon cochleariae]|uniref:Uncharacterized protein n=1 Tax=Phaedon cochleariae TaxID=80249 RepID=A0A9P0E046_PHACE|nr:unnamed protein product [Phaedon cochleariae]
MAPPRQQQMAPPPQQHVASTPQQQGPWGARGAQPQQQMVPPPQQQVPPTPQQQMGYHPQQQMGYPPQQQMGYHPQQQMGYPPQQQMGYPPQQQMGYSPQHQQRGPTPQQQRGPSPQQQRGPAPHQQRGPAPQQQRGPAPQQQRGPAPQQQRGPAPQQQRGPYPQQQGGPALQQQFGPAPQQQRDPQQVPGPVSYGAEAQAVVQQPQRGPQKPEGSRPGSSGDQQEKKQPQRGTPKKDPLPTKQLAKVQISESSDTLKYRDVVPGTEGRRIKIETNHLGLSLGNIEIAYHYDVNLVPDTPKKYLRQVMELFRQQKFPKRYPAFDGRKNLYSSSPLPIDGTMSATIVYRELDGRDKEYKVEVKFANEVDMRGLRGKGQRGETPREALQVVDIVLRSAPALSLTAVGRSFFHRPEQIIELGEGMEMYNGFYQSAIRGWKPFLNVDVAHKAFPKSMNVMDALVDLFASDYRPVSREDLARGLERFQLEKFEKFIKTLKVTYEIPNAGATRRSYRVNGVGEPAAVKKFRPNDGPEVTIEKYFADKYRVRLRYPKLPTLWVGNKERRDKMLLPLEFCTIEENQAVNRKMTENQTREMIRHTATNTTVRKDKIMRALGQARYNDNATVREFGFSVASEFEKLEARVLKPPDLGYGGNRKVSVAKGIWRGDRFVSGAVINKWTVVCADRAPRGDELGNFANMVVRHARDCGMTFTTDAEKPLQIIGNRQNDIKSFFQRSKGKYDVIFVVVPNSGPTYSHVKSAAEINTGCLTQCLKMITLSRKMNQQTVMNILLKVNAKLNGLNHVLLTRPPILNRPCMIMGADVTHPSPDSQNIPSVAAVTASHEPKAFKYNICWRLQPPRVEIIEDLQAIVEEQLMFFYKSNNQRKPERIVFFRDGVSEGQFEQVIHSEIRAIRAACKKIQADGYEPAITFLVVQKRHHTRLFPLNRGDSEDKNMNVPAGTCVDKDITHPFLQDFYLVSHASIQGVAKPTKYCTLWDDNNMSNDDVEALAYHLCHMFTRCNRSVSYPAPTYYAHLAAARAKVYIENENLDMNNLNRERQRFLIQDVIRKDLPMFFV